MTHPDEMSLEEIEARLDELREKKDRAENLRDLVGETSDNLATIAGHEFVDDELAAKVDFLQTMLDWAVHHDISVEQAIRYEREQLRRRRVELEREQQLQEGDDA